MLFSIIVIHDVFAKKDKKVYRPNKSRQQYNNNEDDINIYNLASLPDFDNELDYDFYKQFDESQNSHVDKFDAEAEYEKMKAEFDKEAEIEYKKMEAEFDKEAEIGYKKLKAEFDKKMASHIDEDEYIDDDADAEYIDE